MRSLDHRIRPYSVADQLLHMDTRIPITHLCIPQADEGILIV